MQQEPIREVTLSPRLRVYVSDVGCLVIEQSEGDVQHVFVHPEQIPELVNAISLLSASASAKEAAHLAAIDAQYQVWLRSQEGDAHA